MAVRLRLRRDGAKKRPFYHLVAADCRRARNGRFIEELGYYNPIVPAGTDSIIVLKEERVRYWLSVGAQPSDTALSLLQRAGILERKAAPAKPATPAAETTATEIPQTMSEEEATTNPTDSTESSEPTSAESPAAE